jgi:hypothetical protein
MAITRRWAAGAAVLACLVGLAACGGGPAAPGPAAAWPGEPGSPGAPTRLDGTLFFMGVRASVGGIHTYAGGTLTHAVPDESFGFYQTATVSPAGDRYAWVDRGQLWVARFGAIPGPVGPATLDAFFTPQWSADGTRLIVKYESARYGWIDAVSGEIAALPAAPEEYVAFSSDDGTYAVYGSIQTETYRTVRMGSAAAVPVVAPSSRYYTRFQSVSPNARHAIALIRATAGARGDVARAFSANAIVDLTTGTLLVVPGGGTLRQGFFRADRTAVLRVTQNNTDQVLLVSPSGEVVDRLNLPREAADLPLLGYAPPAPEEPEPTEPELPVLAGTVYLLGSGDAAGGVHTLRGGDLDRAVADTSAQFVGTVAVSPDGTRYAWLAESGGGVEARVATFGGTADAIGPTTVDPTFPPQWSADGESLLVRLDDATFGWVDAASGAVTAVPPAPAPYLRVSPDGAYAVYGSGGAPPTAVARVEPGATPEPVMEPEAKDYARIQSLSPNGRHAIVHLVDDGGPVGDTARSLTANAIVDLVTGTLVPVPGGGTLRQGFFRVDGTLVLRVEADADRVLLVSPTGEILGTVDLPPDAADLALLGYAA